MYAVYKTEIELFKKYEGIYEVVDYDLSKGTATVVSDRATEIMLLKYMNFIPEGRWLIT